MQTDYRQAAAEAAAALVAGGLSLAKASDQIGAEYGVVGRTVRNWITKAGIEVRTEQSQGFKDFNERRRAEVGNHLVDILERTIAQIDRDLTLGLPVAARDVRELTIAFGVLTDKRRLEDGLSTDRIETEMVPAREIIADKLEDMAGRKSERD